MTLFLLPIFSILIGIGLMVLVNYLEVTGFARIIKYFILGCVIVSVLFSNFMMHHWIFAVDPRTGATQWMQERTYHTVLFFENRSGSAIVGGTGFDHQMRAFSSAGKITWPGWDIMMGKSYDSVESQDFISRYGVEYVVENENTPGDLVAHYSGRAPSPFLRSIRRSKDKIYDNSLEGIWSLG